MVLVNLGILERSQDTQVQYFNTTCVVSNVDSVGEEARSMEMYRIPHVGGHHLELYECCPLDTKISRTKP